MSADSLTPDGRRLPDPPDFSPFLGGPLFQLLRRTRLSGDAMELLHRRIVVIALVAWLPLLVLSTLASLQGYRAEVPFLADFAVHARFLLAMPLLIVAELVVHQRMRSVVSQFLERQLVPEGAMPRFHAAIASALKLRDSVFIEAALVALVYAVGVQVVWRHYTVPAAATWYVAPTAGGGGSRLSLAGVWYGYVSMPLFQFLLCRWYFRLFVWARFLWHVSRLDLRVQPLHPDRAGGLGFLGGTSDALGPFVAAHGALLAGMIANQIFHLGAALPDFRTEVLVTIVVLLCVTLGPLLVFAPQLARSRRTGSREYGTLAARYAREFDAKWLRGGAAADESLLGSGDIQSLADLGNSFEVVRTMRPVPFASRAVVQLAFTTLAPIVPLALTMMPLDELVKKLFGILF